MAFVQIADLLKYADLHTCYHAKFGHSVLKGVGSARTLLSWDGRRGSLQDTRSSSTCVTTSNLVFLQQRVYAQTTRSSADADNRLDAFSGQSRSTNMVPFHMLHIVSYCAIVTLSLRQCLKGVKTVFTIFVFKKFHDLEMGVKGHSRSLRVVSFDRLCMVSY